MLNSCTVAAFDVSAIYMCNARAQHEDIETNQQGMCVKGCKYGLGSREVGGRLELSQVDRDHVVHDNSSRVVLVEARAGLTEVDIADETTETRLDLSS